MTDGNQLIETHSLSPTGDSIVYDRGLGENLAIYKRALAGGPATLLVDLPGHAYSPQWSPDGSEIAFHWLPPRSQKAKIHTVPAAGGTPVALPDMPGDDSNPVWSPDGLTIAFMSWVPGLFRTNVWIVSRDRVGGDWTAPTMLTDFYCSYPKWDSDGASVWCRTPRDAAGAAALVRVSMEGEVLARYDDFLGVPLLSPDGSRIYFVYSEEDGSRGVWWIPIAGGTATKIVAFDDPSVHVFGVPTVGPESIYFTIAERQSDIYVTDLEW